MSVPITVIGPETYSGPLPLPPAQSAPRRALAERQHDGCQLTDRPFHEKLLILVDLGIEDLFEASDRAAPVVTERYRDPGADRFA
jgi:hypothetical protein